MRRAHGKALLRTRQRAMAQIVLENVSKRYSDGVFAVRSLDIKIEDGEFLVLVGPSGCGKSTALRMVAGLEDINEGNILIGGRIANDLSPRERNIAMVFQSYALYPHLTVAENIGFGLRVRGASKDEIAVKVRDAAQILELSDYLGRKPAQLSGGQRQRVAMGRAIVRQPHAFLMDEPLSNLDARLRVQMRAEIANIQKMTGVTTIYVTHDQVEAMTMGDRVAVMNRGVLQQIDAPRRLYHEPANLFVASFIGSPAISLIEGDIAAEADGLVLTLGNQPLALPATSFDRNSPLAGYVGRKVVVGLRPEALIVGKHDSAMQAAINGDVAFVEDLGGSLLVHFDVDAAPPKLDADGVGLGEVAPEIASRGDRGRVRAMVGGFTEVRQGDRLPIAVDLERLHLFDSRTGLAIRTRTV
jgi:multiple sugar transport system ATP-binding protein